MNSVSVLIPVYNSAPYIYRAIKSVLDQEGVDLEIILVDDFSTDESIQLIESFQSSNLRLIRHNKNLGPGAARNTGIRAARKANLALLDSDDYYLPGRLFELLTEKEHYKSDAVFDNILVQYDGNSLNHHEKMFPSFIFQKHKLISLQDLIEGTRFTKGVFPLGFCKPVFDLSFLRTHKLFYEQSLRISQDYMFLCNFLACGGTLKGINTSKYVYTKRKGSNSHRIMSKHWLAMIRCDNFFYKKYKLSFLPKHIIKNRKKWLWKQYYYTKTVEFLKLRNYAKGAYIFLKKPSIINLFLEPLLKRMGFFKKRI